MSVRPNATSSGTATAANQAAEQALLGALTEAVPASDTASSGLNGRLQRIAQRLTTIIGQLPASLGQKVGASSLPVVLASDQWSSTVESAPAATTMSTVAYAAGDVVGTLLTFTGAVVSNGKSGRIDAMQILEKTGTQMGALELWLFSAAPTGINADNGAWNVSDADMAACLGVIACGPWYTGSLNAVSVRAGVGLPFKAGGATTSIYGYLVIREAKTYGTATDLTVKLVIAPDV